MSARTAKPARVNGAPHRILPSSPPVVHVRRSPSGRGLIIDKCSYCGKKHLHGDGGKRERGDHGHRLAHCVDPCNQRAAAVGYILVEVAEQQSFPVAASPRVVNG